MRWGVRNRAANLPGMIRAAIMLLLLIGPAAGHEWYPPACCSGGDCGPLEDSRVHPLAGGGYLIDGLHYVRPADVKDSQDGRFHGCFPSKDKLVCFFAPPRGM